MMSRLFGSECKLIEIFLVGRRHFVSDRFSMVEDLGTDKIWLACTPDSRVPTVSILMQLEIFAFRHLFVRSRASKFSRVSLTFMEFWLVSVWVILMASVLDWFGWIQFGLDWLLVGW